jgi:hypothetical protein
MRRLGALLGLALVVALLPLPVGADHGGATVVWTALLPPDPRLSPVSETDRRCGPDGGRCLRDVERRLARMAADLDCDHRAVFATTYQLLTRELRREVERRPQAFDDPAGVGLLAKAFFGMYERTLAAHERGQPVPPAWQVALDAAQSAEHNAGQDMLLGINAHVQRDMAFALAAVGLRTPDGRSRKPDHDRINRVLSRAYDEIVPEVARRYDPFMVVADAKPSPVDDVGSQQLVALWREGVWRNAERLVAAESAAKRQRVAATIERHAEMWALGIAVLETPGYRAVRAEYCARPRGTD